MEPHIRIRKTLDDIDRHDLDILIESINEVLSDKSRKDKFILALEEKHHKYVQNQIRFISVRIETDCNDNDKMEIFKSFVSYETCRILMVESKFYAYNCHMFDRCESPLNVFMLSWQKHEQPLNRIIGGLKPAPDPQKPKYHVYLTYPVNDGSKSYPAKVLYFHPVIRMI
tara:strand:+ start:26087 stop:26596 length:510 start_codon:yes stop_codon:yes gene_type:complete